MSYQTSSKRSLPFWLLIGARKTQVFFFLFSQIYFEITFSISFSPLLFFLIWCSFLYCFRMDFWLASFPGTRSRGKVNGKIDTGFFSHFFLVLFAWIKTLSEKNAVYQLKLKVWKVGPMSHFISRLSLIVRVNVVLNRTVVVDSDWRFDKLCRSHLQSKSEFYHVNWWY